MDALMLPLVLLQVLLMYVEIDPLIHVIKKMNEAVTKALIVNKKRTATKPSKASKLKRLDSKKKVAAIKQNRKKLKGDE